MKKFTERHDIYRLDFERFEKAVAKNGHSFVDDIRKAAMARFSELSFPTRRQEEWKYTNVAPIVRTSFKPAFELASQPSIEPERIEGFTFPGLRASRIVFINGRFSREHSLLDHLAGAITVGSLAEALQTDGKMLETHLARYAVYENHAFTALNSAFIQDGALVHIPKRHVLEDPIHIVYVSIPGQEPIVSYPRNLIVVEEGSQASILESYVGLGDDLYFTNAVTEVVLKDGAVLEHYKVQEESERAFHIATTQVHQEQNTSLNSHSASLGGALARNEINSVLDGPGANCSLTGFYVGCGRQHVDTHTTIDHAKPHCTSFELYKGILNDHATGVFNGKVIVRPDAQKTSAQQSNHNLLLSENAEIDTKPALEIYADDVRCTHGATIGQLDEDALFYLRARGLRRQDARDLLVYAFASESLERIKFEPIRTRLQQRISVRIGNHEGDAV